MITTGRVASIGAVVAAISTFPYHLRLGVEHQSVSIVNLDKVGKPGFRRLESTVVNRYEALDPSNVTPSSERAWLRFPLPPSCHRSCAYFVR